MRILITRPREDAAALAEKLKARGHEVLIEPMLEIRLVPDASVDLSRVQAVLFTSANGVRAFAAAEARRDLPTFAVGDTTAVMARAVGFTQVESASGNVESLARLVRERLKPADGVVLHAAGSAVAGDLAGDLTQSGFEVRRVVLYTAEPVAALSPVVAAALKARQVDMAVFFSPRTAETFVKLIAEAGLASALSRTVALGLSPAIVKAVAGLPWAMTESARQPQEADLIRAIARHKIITQLEGRPVEEEAPEVVFGRRSDDPSAPTQGAPRSEAPVVTPRNSRLTAAVSWLAVLLSLGTFTLVLLQGERSSTGASGNLAAAVALRLETRLAALERQIASLSATSPQADPQAEARLQALIDKVAVLEARPMPALPVDADLSRRLEALEKASAERPAPPPPAVPEEFAARVAALESALAARPDVGQIAAALAENRRQSAELARLQEQIATFSAGLSRAGGREGLLLAVGQLREALRQGRPFAAELATVQALAGDEPALTAALAALQPFVNRFVLTRDALTARFPGVAADAARAAQAAAMSADAAADNPVGEWWNGVMRRLSSVVSVRRVGEVAGDTPVARLARAEQAVTSGDLAAAAGALDGLSGSVGETVGVWRAEARARMELDRASEALLAAALAASATAPGTGQ